MKRWSLHVLALLPSVLAACAGERAPDSDAQPVTPAVPSEEAAVPEAVPETPAPARVGLARFRLAGDEAGCPSQADGDCVSFIELRADGTVELDPWGAPGTAVLTAHIGADELERVAPTLTAEDLLAQLARTPACPGANRTETMLVTLGGDTHQNATGHCNEPPVQAVRAVLIELAARHFPDHHLVSPPF